MPSVVLRGGSKEAVMCTASEKMSLLFSPVEKWKPSMGNLMLPWDLRKGGARLFISSAILYCNERNKKEKRNLPGSMISCKKCRLNEHQRWMMQHSQNWKPRIVLLITGGAGFIGSHLAEELLNKSDEV